MVKFNISSAGICNFPVCIGTESEFCPGLQDGRKEGGRDAGMLQRLLPPDRAEITSGSVAPGKESAVDAGVGKQRQRQKGLVAVRPGT